MKKLILSFCGLASVCLASAQLSVGVNGNYTMYKGDFQKKTPGIGARISYDVQPRVTVVLSYTHGMPIKSESQVTMQSNNGSASRSVNSEIKNSFKTFNLLGQYAFVGSDEESSGKFYGVFGAGFVLAKYKEDVKETYDKSVYTPMDQIEGSENGFTLNFGLGGEYTIGTPRVFAEAGLALPANQVNNTYVQNVIPAHFVFNVGVKIPLGGGSDY
ncbi:MAG TPA: hypothetical protein VM935_04170 [Chitinophagaceae bacterium]|nr:hypothetical protein [Chitinophagaceae bacterium]